MNEAEYKAAEGIRRSDLWLIQDSPEKFKWAVDHPEEDTQTPALTFGAAAHKILLEPTEFFLEYAIAPDVDRRTKEGKAAWAEFVERESGKTVLDRETYDTIKDMANKVMANPTARKLFSGRKELPFFWTDPDTGVKCKVKLDCLTWVDDDEIPTITDYKTTKSARTEDFRRDCYKYGYHLQAAMYTEAVMICHHLKKRPKFKFVVQEKDPCYAINIITVPDDVMMYGLDTFRELLGIYHECEVTGVWPGYMGPFSQENELSLPGWLVKDMENEN